MTDKLDLDLMLYTSARLVREDWKGSGGDLYLLSTRVRYSTACSVSITAFVLYVINLKLRVFKVNEFM